VEGLEAGSGGSDKVRMILKTEGLTKMFRQGFSEVHAVRETNVEISRGERICIYGPSGAGKSTLLNMLGALNKPTKGKVIFNGKNVYAMSDRARSALRNRRFGFIFQFYHLLPELNVYENVILPAAISGKEHGARVKEKAMALLELVKMSHRIKHKPSQISGGEAQRVAVARALINSPDILFCDEPTGNLDSEMRLEIYDLIRRLSESNNMSVVVVTHQELPEGFAGSEYFMQDGVLSKVRENVNVGAASPRPEKNRD